ncbi:MAG: hypothetical protein QW594_02935, partial [Candidatus Woesearchaeota archaeon]
EIMLLVIIITIKQNNILLPIIFFSAVIEELIRNLPLLVAVREKQVSLPKAIGYAFAVGFGFFAAEKLLLLLSIAPFAQAYHVLQLGYLIAPLLLHCLLGVLFVVILRQTKSAVFANSIAILAHTLINYTFFSAL